MVLENKNIMDSTKSEDTNTTNSNILKLCISQLKMLRSSIKSHIKKLESDLFSTEINNGNGKNKKNIKYNAEIFKIELEKLKNLVDKSIKYKIDTLNSHYLFYTSSKDSVNDMDLYPSYIINTISEIKEKYKNYLFTSSRERDIVYRRDIICYYLNINLLVTKGSIAALLFNDPRKRTIIYHSNQKVKDLLYINDSYFVNLYNSMISELSSIYNKNKEIFDSQKK